MISLDQCKKVVNKGRKKLSDEEIKKIREFLNLLKEIDSEKRKKIDESSNIY